jgi:single-strand DNA-binding protein
MNQLTLIGNLTRDPETKTGQSGKAFTVLSVAWNDPFDKEGKATYFKLTAFGKTGEIIQSYCKKGEKHLFQGTVKLEEWATKEGEKRASIAMIVDRVQLLGSKRDGGSASQDEPRRMAPADAGNYTAPREEAGNSNTGADDDLPF